MLSLLKDRNVTFLMWDTRWMHRRQETGCLQISFRN